MQEGGTIQWFPGHMARTRRKIKESLGLVDATVEIIDARIPISSRNPELKDLVGEKPRLVVLNKADLADEASTKSWLAEFQKSGAAAMAADCKSGRGMERFTVLLREALADKLAVWESKGMKNRPIRVMVLGIPNAGKSSFINRMARGGKAKVEDRPGVTSIQTYQLGELLTYSEKTLQLLKKHLFVLQAEGRSLAEEVMSRSVCSYGFSSLGDAERYLAKRTGAEYGNG
mgnify:CR=1 FL=1